MKIFTIIVTYDAMRNGWIDRCLKSLKDSTCPSIAIVVDNGSKDGTCQHIHTKHPDVVWLPQDKNLGFGQANNVGICYAMQHDADYILLLNQDASLKPDAIEQMIACSDGHSVVSPLHLNGNGTKIDNNFRLRLLDTGAPILDDLLAQNTSANVYYGGHYPAACWLIPASVINTIGGFNPLFFHYGEDNNFLHRMDYHHIKMSFVPKAVMYHDRLQQGNMKMFKKGILQRYMLGTACDITKSVSGVLKAWFKELIFSYTHGIPHREYIPGQFTAVLLWILFHLNRIRLSRKAEKKQGATWLEKL
jgi:GT2 family glycosyltransferase